MKAAFLILLLAVSVASAQVQGFDTGGGRGLGVRLLGSSSSTSAASTYNATLTDIQMPSLIFAMVVSTKASAPDIPTFSTPNGLTWTQIRTTNYNTLASPISRLTVFYSKVTSGMFKGVVSSADFGGNNQTGCIVAVVEVAGAEMTGGIVTNAIAQIVHGGANVNTNATATFAAYSGTRNLALGFVGGSLNSQNDVAESGWTKLFGGNYNTPATEAAIVYQVKASDTSLLVTNAASISWATVGVEVKQQ